MNKSKFPKNSCNRSRRIFAKAIMLPILFLLLHIPAFAHYYSLSTSSTTNGGGTWGPILKMSGYISGNNVTFSVQKTSGTFSLTNNVYLKVGTYEPYGVNRATGIIYAGGYQWSHTHDLSPYSYPKDFYFRVESTDGYAWAGPITVYYNNNNPYNHTVISEPTSGSVGQSLTYSYRISDPDNDRVKIHISWGDGSPTWDSGLRSSGSTVSCSHSYGSVGTYNLYTTVFDEHGASSSVRHVQVNINEVVPSTPPPPTVTANGPTSVYISWNSVPGAAKYTVWRSTSAYGTYKQIYCSSPTNYTDSGSHLSPNTTYYYKLRAGNSAADCYNPNSSGWSGYSAFTSVTTPPDGPPKPDKPTVTATGPTSVYIRWGSVPGATKYTVWRSTSAYGTYKQIYCSSPTNYTDSGSHLSPVTTYYYKIRAGYSYADCANANSSGWSEYSSYTSITTLSDILPPPSKPSVTATGPTSVYVSWGAVTGAAKYTVWRSTSAYGTYKQIYCSIPTYYNDSGSHLTPNTTYYYKIRAGNNVSDCSNPDSSGWSDYSNYASVKTLDDSSCYVPVIYNVSPSSVEAGAGAGSVIIEGDNFQGCEQGYPKAFIGNLNNPTITVLGTNQIQINYTSVNNTSGYQQTVVKNSSELQYQTERYDVFEIKDQAAGNGPFPKTCIKSVDATCKYAKEDNVFADKYIGECTWYAYGRVQELVDGGYLGKEVGDLFYNTFKTPGGRDAKNWDNLLGGDWISTSLEPLPEEKRKPGLLAVWDGGIHGHVAFVEEVKEDKSKYRVSDFNLKKDKIYRDQIWRPFVGDDRVVGVYPKFLDLTLYKNDPEILNPFDGKIELNPSGVTFSWKFNNPSHTVSTVKFTLKEASGYSGTVGKVLCSQRNIGKVTTYNSAYIATLKNNQWYK